jgi:hypothetical protein
MFFHLTLTFYEDALNISVNTQGNTVHPLQLFPGRPSYRRAASFFLIPPTLSLRRQLFSGLTALSLSLELFLGARATKKLFVKTGSQEKSDDDHIAIQVCSKRVLQ